MKNMIDRMLKIKNVSKHLNGVRIVNDVTAGFSPGKITALIGPNGAGKTTLFNLIAGELKPDSGKVTYRGTEITRLAPYKIAQQGVGRLFQDVRLFENLTVFQNVASACYREASETPWYPFFNWKALKEKKKNVIEEVDYWLHFVGLLGAKNDPAAALSYGQQKLLAIARLLARGVNVFLLDEPTAGLNSVMIKKVLELFENIVKQDTDKILILVEHDMNVIKEVANWVYFMHDGKITFFGMTDHVLGDKEVREIYLGF